VERIGNYQQDANHTQDADTNIEENEDEDDQSDQNDNDDLTGFGGGGLWGDLLRQLLRGLEEQESPASSDYSGKWRDSIYGKYRRKQKVAKAAKVAGSSTERAHNRSKQRRDRISTSKPYTGKAAEEVEYQQVLRESGPHRDDSERKSHDKAEPSVVDLANLLLKLRKHGNSEPMSSRRSRFESMLSAKAIDGEAGVDSSRTKPSRFNDEEIEYDEYGKEKSLRLADPLPEDYHQRLTSTTAPSLPHSDSTENSNGASSAAKKSGKSTFNKNYTMISSGQRKGKFQSVARAGEIDDVALGNDLNLIAPSERLRFVSKIPTVRTLAKRDFCERRLLNFDLS
jgi:hypothetical protein